MKLNTIIENPRKITEEIADLHGNIFKVIFKDWEFQEKVPNLENYQYAYTRDLNTNISFISILDAKGNGFASFYNLTYELYVIIPIKKVGYDESKDIRKAYLYGKRKH